MQPPPETNKLVKGSFVANSVMYEKHGKQHLNPAGAEQKKEAK